MTPAEKQLVEVFARAALRRMRKEAEAAAKEKPAEELPDKESAYQQSTPDDLHSGRE